MGICCVGKNILNQEIEDSKTIAELLALLEKTKKTIPQEREEIRNYIKDKNTEIKAIRFIDLSEINLKKRLGYLDELEPYYDKYIEALNKNPNLPLNETKARLQELYGAYITMFDDSNSLCKSTYEGFDNFVKESAKTEDAK